MFIDIAKIKVKAGDGGDGAVAFHREKYVASGGPDGGDGGRGGDIVFRVDDNLSTLADFRYKRKYTAERGENGRGKRCFGKSAQPLVITVPRGTLIRNAETGRIMADMSTDEDVVIAKGGRGGWGNTRRLRARLHALQSPAHPVKHSSFSLNSSCSPMWALWASQM